MKPSNIALAFKKCRQEHRPALLTYTVSGDPNKKKSFEILKAISSYADICEIGVGHNCNTCLLYTSPSPRDRSLSRMPSSA